jgi:small-conductance mechanosensitive channel
MDWNDLWAWTFLGNTLAAWVASLVVAIVVFVGLVVLKRVMVGQLNALVRRAESDLGSVAVAALRGTRLWFLGLVALRAATLVLIVPGRIDALLETAVVIAVLIQFAIWLNKGVTQWLRTYTDRNIESDAAAVTTMRAVVFLARLAAWSIVLLLALDNLGYNITALIAGLGVGGIAVALAVQNILGDLFASLSIVVDKPFVVGDFIIVDEYLGTVQHIGLKTTRVASLSGEQLIFSNTDLLKSRIRNYKRMNERRIVFSFSIVYQTPLEDLRMIPDMVREIVDSQELARFDRAHFKEFGDSALVFEVVYHVSVPDFNAYMDVQQSINLALFERFADRGIDFAYPTQTLYMRRQPGNGEAVDVTSSGAAPLKPD